MGASRDGHVLKTAMFLGRWRLKTGAILQTVTLLGRVRLETVMF